MLLNSNGGNDLLFSDRISALFFLFETKNMRQRGRQVIIGLRTQQRQSLNSMYLVSGWLLRAQSYLAPTPLSCHILVYPTFGFPWDYPVNEKIPNSTWANFKGFPRTDSLTSPLKDAKKNVLLKVGLSTPTREISAASGTGTLDLLIHSPVL